MLSDPSLDPLFAYMFMCSEISGEGRPEELEDYTTVKGMFAAMSVFSKTPECETFCLIPESQEASPEPLSQVNLETSEKDHIRFERSNNLCLKRREALRRAKTNNLAFFERRPRVKLQAADATPGTETSAAKVRHELVAQAVVAHPNLLDKERLSEGTVTCLHFTSQEYLVARVRNWPSEDLLRKVNGLAVGMMLWTSNLAYGAIHAAAWNDHFPSIAEKWLWCASAVYIAFAGGL